MILLSYFSLLVICFLPYLIGKFQIGETHLGVNKDAQATFSRDGMIPYLLSDALVSKDDVRISYCGKPIPRPTKKKRNSIRF